MDLELEQCSDTKSKWYTKPSQSQQKSTSQPTENIIRNGGIFAAGVREILDLRNALHTTTASAEQYQQDKIVRGKHRRQLKLDQ